MDRKTITKGFFWTFGANFLTKAVLLVTGILIAHLIGPAEMGMFFVVNTVFLVAEVFRDAGLAQTYIAEAAMDSPKEQGFHMLSMVTSVALAVAILALSPFLAGPGGARQMEGIALAALGTVSNGYGAISLAKLYRDGRFREAGLCDAVGTFVGSALALGLVFAGQGYRALVWQLVARAFVSTLLQIKWAPVGGFRWERDVVAHVFRASRSVLASNGINSMFLLMDQFIVVRLLGEAAGGNYGVAKNLASRPIDLISTPLNRTMFTAYSKNSGDRTRMAAVFARSLGATALLVLPIFVLMFVLAGPIVLLLFGKAFAPAIPVLKIMSFYFGARSFGTLAGSMLIASDHVKQNLTAWVVGTLVTVSALLTPYGRGSLAGFSVAFASGAVVAYALSVLFALRMVPPAASDWPRIGKGLAVTAIASIVAGVMAILPLSIGLLVLAVTTSFIFVHLTVSSLVFTGNGTAFLRVKGLKEIWQRL